MRLISVIVCISLFAFIQNNEAEVSWIRINQLGYQPNNIKVAVWCTKGKLGINNWELVDAKTNKIVFKSNASNSFGAYGPFSKTSRLNFTTFNIPGGYFLQAGNTKSPTFEIGEDVYKGAADFCLRYMRQQRSGFNPFLKDSCHMYDGYSLYGEKAGIPDSTHIDVVGGWHDASDYLQYSTTTANATYHLLAAYRDFPNAFADEKLANGLDGKNNLPDILDEAKWGLEWLLKMHPTSEQMFNQLGDDRDHISMRIPKLDSQYGRGFERPVYFVSGEPQQRGKFMNNSTGKSSTAGKFAGAFSLGYQLFESKKEDAAFSLMLYEKAITAYDFGKRKPGFSQTASVRSPYIYAEENWTDDMELAAASLFNSTKKLDYQRESFAFSKIEKITPWLGTDTAKHYQWYPFINLGHYELAKQLKDKRRDTIIAYYKQGIEKVWGKAKLNAFYRGIPFIWCSNNLTTSFAIQCYWYNQLSGDKTYDELEQANLDWLFGCNPWGTSMVYGLPSWGDTPVDPHSAFTHLKNYPIDGGLVDGPVYGSIYKNLIGITLYQPDEYAAFQSDLAVYHDDYGDYSTNEPTMDGTASLIYLLAAKESVQHSLKIKENVQPVFKKKFSYSHGAIIRGDSANISVNGETKKGAIAIVFTGHEFAEGGEFISKTLTQQKIKASFFFTGKFYANPAFKKIIQDLITQGNYMGAHSNEHLLYCDWNKRDSLLITKEQFIKDIKTNYKAMAGFGIKSENANYFLPPYEWYNDSIATWTKQAGFSLISYSPGTLSQADYTTVKDKNYRNSQTIYQSILQYEKTKPAGLNGFVLLMHIGAGPDRTDKLYNRLPELITYLKQKGYQFQTVDKLFKK